MRISQISEIIVASTFLWAAAIAWMNAPGPATGLAAPETVSASSSVTSSQCMSGYCVALPLVAVPVPEVDVPPCRWQYTPGQYIWMITDTGILYQQIGTMPLSMGLMNGGVHLSISFIITIAFQVM